LGAYNPNYSGVVSVLVEYPKGYRDPDNLIEKEMHGGSLRREATLKSSEGFAEEI